MSKLQLNFSFNQFVVGLIQFTVAGILATFVNVWLGILVAMIRVNAR